MIFFLRWHREYLTRVELTLRQIDTSIGIPYIDWTLDDALDHPRDSILFSEYLMGDTSGKRDNENGSWVINGPFKDFATAHGNPRLTRWVGEPIEDPVTKEMVEPRPMTQENVDYLLNAENVDQIITFSMFKDEKGCKYSDQIKKAQGMDPENAHGRGHVFVGGDMGEFSTASNDPIFYMHHAFVDFLWEEWRKTKQDPSQWETGWITDSEACSAPQHFKRILMYPFIPMLNEDGLSINYTKNMYKYEPRPICNRENIDCKSEFLFCDLTKGKKGPRCASKIKKGKPCDGYEHNEDVCYLGECIDGICVENDSILPNTPPPEPTVVRETAKQAPAQQLRHRSYATTHLGTGATTSIPAVNTGARSANAKGTQYGCRATAKFHVVFAIPTIITITAKAITTLLAPVGLGRKLSIKLSIQLRYVSTFPNVPSRVG
ncbi:hypothetical protein WR25_25768 [Diploscapter pachys]|uniref:Tyrosinase copper-binding domain-containing protein n=1 Tax=Diploscapter pachys TaxID=2018661 RepID=A0A2A2J702_9BILA|nr:hypothetical protein WR25_25768 [Diploscapter pachys]